MEEEAAAEAMEPVIHALTPIITIENAAPSSNYGTHSHTPIHSPPHSPWLLASIDYETRTPAWARLPSTVSLGKESRFREELELTEENLDTLLRRRDAAGMFAKAIKATEAERAAFLLPEHKYLSRMALSRPRSASYCLPTTAPSISTAEYQTVGKPIRSHSDSHLHRTPTQFLTPDFDVRRKASLEMSPNYDDIPGKDSTGSSYRTPPSARTKALPLQKLSPHVNCADDHSYNRFLSPDDAMIAEQKPLRVLVEVSKLSTEYSMSGIKESSRLIDSLSSPLAHRNSLSNMVRRIMTLSSSGESNDTLHPGPSSETSIHTQGAKSESPYNLTPIQLSNHSIDAVIGASGSIANGKDSLGAWARYPSHTRPTRTGSAGEKDKIITRDFVYAPKPPLYDQTDKETRPRGKGKGKIKVKLSQRKMVRKLDLPIDSVRDFFTAPSLDYLQHGYGRRSSISPGFAHSEPDLEPLPEV
jgi:hypothetical protein